MQMFLKTQQIEFFPTHPFAGAQTNYKHFQPSTIAEIRGRMSYVQLTRTGSVADFVDAFKPHCVAPAAVGMPPNGSPPAAAPTWPRTRPA